MRRVVISGAGLISPFGQSFEAFCDATFDGRSGVRSQEFTHYSLPVSKADFDDSSEAGPADAMGAPRVVKMAIHAARAALAHAGLGRADLAQNRQAGVFMGVGNAPVDVICEQLPELQSSGYVSAFSLLRALPSGVATYVSLDLGATGSCRCYTSACASASLAIGQAFQAIARGDLTYAIAGGAESPLHPGVIASWKALRALAPLRNDAPARSSRPFDLRRRGLVLGEGAAVFMLEDRDHAVARNAPILAEILAFGESCDAHHITRPEEGGQLRCMENALRRIDRRLVSLIVAHGTGTPAGDIIESSAIRAAFGASAGNLRVVSNKALIGHTLGASGGFNLATALMALAQGRVPGSYHIEEPDPRINLDVMANRSEYVKHSAVLINCFAFGGINNSLICSSPTLIS